MGVYIKGVSMPTDHPMWIIVLPDGTVEANEVSQSRHVGWKTLRNAAVPVPPHGRLIDGDVAEGIYFTEEDENGKDFCDGILYAADWISEQPTIIPAEPPKEEV